MSRILAAARSLLDPHRHVPPVHFHSRSTNHPEVCYDAGCTRPRLQVR